MASAVRDNVEGRHLWQQQRRMTCLASDRGGLLQHGWNFLVRHNVGRRCKQHPWFTGSTTVASCEGKQREKFGPQLRFWCCFRSFGCGASLLALLAASSKRFRSVSFVAGVGSPCAREGRSPTTNAARPSRVVSHSDSVFSLCQGVFLRCSDIAAEAPTRRWPSQCGGICPICFFFSDGPRRRLDVYKCVLVVERCGCVFFSVAVLCSIVLRPG
jgi:hypothetical protein